MRNTDSHEQRNLELSALDLDDLQDIAGEYWIIDGFLSLNKEDLIAAIIYVEFVLDIWHSYSERLAV